MCIRGGGCLVFMVEKNLDQKSWDYNSDHKIRFCADAGAKQTKAMFKGMVNSHSCLLMYGFKSSVKPALCALCV